jgi:hypothetical protein
MSIYEKLDYFYKKREKIKRKRIKRIKKGGWSYNYLYCIIPKISKNLIIKFKRKGYHPFEFKIKLRECHNYTFSFNSIFFFPSGIKLYKDDIQVFLRFYKKEKTFKRIISILIPFEILEKEIFRNY